MVTLAEKVGLLRGLLDGRVSPVGPFMVTADVTDRCNLRCLGCRSHSTHAPFPVENTAKADVSLSLMEWLCEGLRRSKTSYFMLSGDGEPMLNPRVFEIVAMGKRAGCHVTMFTNGTLLTPANVASLIECGLDVLRVSLWAGSSEEYAKNYPGSPSEQFENVAEGLHRLSAARKSRGVRKPRLILHEPLNRHNMRGLPGFVELAATTGCDGVSFSPMRAWGGSHMDSILIGEEDLGELRQTLRSARGWLDERALSHNITEVLTRFDTGADVWAVSACYIAWLHTRVRLDGTVQACLTCDYKLGDLNRQSLEEIWNGEGIRQFRGALSQRSAGALPGDCDCSYCCYLPANLQVHRIYRWLAPLANLGQRVMRRGNTLNDPRVG
jgi:MoaA/NifB/PqqE/SkfB family radical SAM enzyme